MPSKSGEMTCEACGYGGAFPAAAVECSKCWRDTTMGMALCSTCSADAERCMICGIDITQRDGRNTRHAYDSKQAAFARELGRDANARWHRRIQQIGDEYAAQVLPFTAELEARLAPTLAEYTDGVSAFLAEYSAACRKINAIRAGGSSPTEADQTEWREAHDRCREACKPFAAAKDVASAPIYEWYREVTRESDVARQGKLDEERLRREAQISDAEFQYSLGFQPWWRAFWMRIRRELF